MYLLNEPVGALIGVRLAHGFSYGVCSTTIATVITSVVPPERKGEGIGYFMLSITLGSAIGPFAGIFLANNFGYPVVFVVAVAASVEDGIRITCPMRKFSALSPGLASHMSFAETLYFTVSR